MNVLNNPLVQRIINEKDLEIAELKAGRIFNFPFEPRENQRPYYGVRDGQREVNPRQKRNIFNNFKESINAWNNGPNDYLRKYKLKCAKMVLVPEDFFTELEFDIDITPPREVVGEVEGNTNLDYLYLKDRFNISCSLWKIIRKFVKPDLPTLNILDKLKNSINALFPINELASGCYVEPSYWINFQLEQIAKKNISLFLNKDVLIKVELDGFIIARETPVLNFSFAVVNEGNIAATAFGTYPLGFFQIKKENYEELEKIVPVIWEKIQSVDEFNYAGKRYIIIYIDCNDHKIQAINSGISAANSSYPCIECECHKDNLHDIVNISQPRTLERQQQFNIFYGNNKRRPLLNLSFDRRPPDMLHGGMRHEDRLIINAYGELQRLDGAADTHIYDPSVHKNVHKFLTLVKTRTSFNLKPDDQTFAAIRNMFTSMVGNKRQEIISSIDIYTEFQDVLGPMRAEQINWLWTTYIEFAKRLPKYKEDIEIIRRRRILIDGTLISEQQANMIYADELEARNKYWCKVYVKVYGADAVTPYIHRYANHLADGYRRWGDLYNLIGEGFEYSHFIARRSYESSNNKIRGRGEVSKFLKHLLLKRLRCAYYEKILNYKYNCNGKKIYNNDIEETIDENENFEEMIIQQELNDQEMNEDEEYEDEEYENEAYEDEENIQNVNDGDSDNSF